MGTSSANEPKNEDNNSFHVTVMSTEREYEQRKEVNWLLDSGCSDHIVNDEKLFSKVEKLHKNVNIKVGDGRIISAFAIGTIVMKCKVGQKETEIFIRNCYYAPDMSRNLLSVSKMTDYGNKIWTEKNLAKIFNSKRELIAVAEKKENLYVLNCQVIEKNISAYTNDTVADEHMSNKEKWHRTLGHVNFKYLSSMCRNQVADGLPRYVEDVHLKCETCLTSKMSRLKFNNNRTRANQILEIIHTDVNGPITQTGYNGEKYFVSFIDDYSKIATVYFMKSKDEVFDRFV